MPDHRLTLPGISSPILGKIETIEWAGLVVLVHCSKKIGLQNISCRLEVKIKMVHHGEAVLEKNVDFSNGLPQENEYETNQTNRFSLRNLATCAGDYFLCSRISNVARQTNDWR